MQGASYQYTTKPPDRLIIVIMIWIFILSLLLLTFFVCDFFMLYCMSEVTWNIDLFVDIYFHIEPWMKLWYMMMYIILWWWWKWSIQMFVHICTEYHTHKTIFRHFLPISRSWTTLLAFFFFCTIKLTKWSTSHKGVKSISI